MNTTQSISNDRLPLDDGRPEPGVVCAANEARFSAAHYSEPLTSFTTGWRDSENLGALLNFIAPVVPVGRRFEFKRAINAEAFLSEDDDVRAIGSPFKRVSYHGESVNEKTFNKGLTIRVDHDEIVGDGWQERYVQLLLQRLQRNELRRAMTALDAADVSSNVIWDGNANPDADLREALSGAADESGVRPNRVIFGETAWDRRAASYETQATAGAFRSASLSPEELARKMFLEGTRVISARYQSSDSAKSAVLAGSVYAFFAMNAAVKDEPSNLKRFVTPVDGGGNYRVYLDEQAKYTDISVEHYSNIVVTSDIGVRKLIVSAGA